VLLCPVNASAEESGADALFRRGVEALRARRYDDAAALFRLSYDMEPRASTMCNLALTHERAGRLQQAAQSYRQCASIDREGRYRDHALRQADELDQRMRASARPTYTRPQPQPQPPPTGYMQTQPPQQQEPQPRRQTHTLAWVGLGGTLLALGSLGTAIGLHVWANGVHDDLWTEYERQIPEGSSAADRVERGRTGVNVAIALYAVGAVLGGVSVLLVILDAMGVGGRASLGSRYALRLAPDGLALVF